jgi:beta-barrel assembly-enhancing protease
MGNQQFQVPQGGGFGDPSHRRKIWRNLVITLVGVILGGWLILWLLGLLAARLVSWVPIDVDVAIGEQNWEELAPASTHCSDPGPLAYVEELAQPLIAAADSEFEFQFVVVDNDEINAFALPGGFITVNMGLLDAAETGEEIAAVIAHEMAHVTNRHGMRAVMRRVGGVALISMVFGGTNLEVIAWAAEGLSSQAHSRDQERDADDQGRAFLMKAGVDPTGMATFFERLEAESAGMPGAAVLLSTHPNPGERAQTTREIAAGFTATLKLRAPPADLTCR